MKNNLDLCMSDWGDGGWSLHIPGNDQPSLSGPGLEDDGNWIRPNSDDYALAHRLIDSGVTSPVMIDDDGALSCGMGKATEDEIVSKFGAKAMQQYKIIIHEEGGEPFSDDVQAENLQDVIRIAKQAADQCDTKDPFVVEISIYEDGDLVECFDYLVNKTDDGE